MFDVQYRAVDQLPGGVPAAVVATGERVIVLVDAALSAAQVCEALTPLIAAHVQQAWRADARILA